MFEKFILIYTDIDLYALPMYLYDVMCCYDVCYVYLWTWAYVRVEFHWYEHEKALCFL